LLQKLQTSLLPDIKARGNRQAKYSGRIVEAFGAEDQQKAKEVAQIVDETIRVKYLCLERPSVTSVHESAQDCVDIAAL
jgi:hypothetical protein